MSAICLTAGPSVTAEPHCSRSLCRKVKASEVTCEEKEGLFGPFRGSSVLPQR